MLLKSAEHRDPPTAPARQSLTPRFALRTATADAHARLDALYSTLDLANRGDYALFLLGHAAAFLPVEDALAAGADAMIPGWTTRLRGGALRADLAVLNLELPAPQRSPAFDSEAALLGGLYVLEGSRLGGTVLARTVPTGLPRAFLGPEPSYSWRAFTALLDQRLADHAALAEAAAAATAVFSVFERCARVALERTPSAR